MRHLTFALLIFYLLITAYTILGGLLGIAQKDREIIVRFPIGAEQRHRRSGADWVRGRNQPWLIRAGGRGQSRGRHNRAIITRAPL